jgi:hypothetical protein
MQFLTILTSIALASTLCGASGTVLAAATNPGASNDVLLDMNQAFKKGQSKRLSELLGAECSPEQRQRG